MQRVIAAFLGLALTVASTPSSAGECDTPQAAWLFCEDFEKGGLGWSDWFSQSPFVQCIGCNSEGNNPARIQLLQDGAQAHQGQWSLYMPAEASVNYQGAALAFRSCAGEKRSGCALRGYEQLYYRAWVKLAPDHQYVHHFMSVGGTRPDGYWEGDGNAGCRPNGVRAAGTTVDFKNSELFFYTYYPEMNCDGLTAGGGYCADRQPEICDGCAAKGMPCTNGPECCWGNHFSADPKPQLPKGRWVCLEMMMKLNSVDQSDGEMAFWVDGQLGHRQGGMRWRDVPELQLNKVWVQHYIASGDASQSNRIWWDDIVASTERIGCGTTPPSADGGSLPLDAGGTPAPDGAPLAVDGSATPNDANTSPVDGGAPAASDGAPANLGVPTLESGCSVAPHALPMPWALLLALLVLWRRRG